MIDGNHKLLKGCCPRIGDQNSENGMTVPYPQSKSDLCCERIEAAGKDQRVELSLMTVERSMHVL